MRGRRLLQRDFGRVAAFKPEHAPYALRRTLLDEVAKRYAGDVEATMRHRFRHPDDLSVPASLAQQYAIATGQAVIGAINSEYVHLESAKLQVASHEVAAGAAVRHVLPQRDRGAVG